MTPLVQIDQRISLEGRDGGFLKAFYYEILNMEIYLFLYIFVYRISLIATHPTSNAMLYFSLHVCIIITILYTAIIVV